ncbi:FCD domain-containing protein [Magnetococcus sp. PR-3]|uniref:FCD domain-containing protein n=1 Tax=Magnetococcus sp. PR-3 TaxID=3120355 RepID=UPI002FCE5C5A
MSYEPIRQAKISDTIAEQLESLITEGVLEPGEKLPPERDLAQQLEVSRPSLREALHKLETQGFLESRQGGGTYVKRIIEPTFTEPLVQLFSTTPRLAHDYVEFRQSLEGMAAYYAAIRATEADKTIMTARFEAMEKAHNFSDPTEEAEADADFHLSIAEASHNLVLLHIVRGLFSLLKRGVFFNRKRLYTRKGNRQRLLDQHRAMLESILEGDPEGAQAAAHTHLTFVQNNMREMGEEKMREELAERRLKSMKAKLEKSIKGEDL